MIGSKVRYPTAYSEAKVKHTEAFIKAASTRKILSCVDKRLKEWKRKVISGSSLESSVYRLVGNDPDLLKGVACLVENKYKDKNRADLIRQSMQPRSERTPIWSDEEEILIKDHELELAIPIENVDFVDTEEKLKDCEEYFEKNKLSNGKILEVGFNTMIIKHPSKTRKEDLALIQLAVNKRVYLIDALYFKVHNIEALKTFIKQIFKTSFILGSNLGADIIKLVRYFDKCATSDFKFDSIDVLGFKTDKLFKETFEKNTSFYQKTENRFVGLSKKCYQVKEVCL